MFVYNILITLGLKIKGSPSKNFPDFHRDGQPKVQHKLSAIKSVCYNFFPGDPGKSTLPIRRTVPLIAREGLEVKSAHPNALPNGVVASILHMTLHVIQDYFCEPVHPDFVR